MASKKKEEGKGIASVLKSINAEFGERSAVMVGDAGIEKVEVFSTGSFSLDLALGVGGLPRGRIVEIYGPESSGKTSLALSVVAQAQKKGGSCVYIDAENALDIEYAAKLGVNTKKLILCQPQGGEQALNIARRFISSGEAAVIVIDSVAALVPIAETEGEIGQAHMGLQARLMSQALRILTGEIKRTNTLVIFINQIRMNLGNHGYGSPETTAGGKALKFYASVRIDIRRIGKLQEGEKTIGNEVRAKTVKNKVAAPFKQAEFYLMFDDGISYEADVLNTALARKVVEKNGNTYLFNGEKIGVYPRGARDAMKANPDLVGRIRDAVLASGAVVVQHKEGDEREG